MEAGYSFPSILRVVAGKFFIPGELVSAKEDTLKWIKRAVVGLDLCPFARTPLERGLIRVSVSRAVTPMARARFFLDELERLQSTRPDKLATTLLVYPRAESDFRDFLDFTASLEVLLKQAQADSLFQLVPFHPAFVLKGQKKASPANLVGRSPWPTVHVLRSEEVALAVKGPQDGEAISKKNRAKLISMSPKERKSYFP